MARRASPGRRSDPVWYPTDAIREEYAARGEDLPKVVHPGPENPLGSHAIYLGLPTYLIHGTNRPYSIGMRVSFGCVRLYPEDIVELYDLVALGTPVRLVDQRVKAGWLGDELHLEVHPSPDLPPDDARPSMTDAVRAIIQVTSEGEQPPVDWKLVEAALVEANGIPAVVGSRAARAKLADIAPRRAVEDTRFVFLTGYCDFRRAARTVVGSGCAAAMSSVGADYPPRRVLGRSVGLVHGGFWIEGPEHVRPFPDRNGSGVPVDDAPVAVDDERLRHTVDAELPSDFAFGVMTALDERVAVIDRATAQRRRACPCS